MLAGDFNDLLASSRRLASGEGDGISSRNLRRGISELEEASLYLVGQERERQPKTSRSIDDIGRGIAIFQAPRAL